jgi:hypothetical protein
MRRLIYWSWAEGVAVRNDRLIRRAVRSRFLVTTDTDESFDGVLTRGDDGFFVFEDAVSIARNGDRLHLDSALWIPRVRVKYMQAVTP